MKKGILTGLMLLLCTVISAHAEDEYLLGGLTPGPYSEGIIRPSIYVKTGLGTLTERELSHIHGHTIDSN